MNSTIKFYENNADIFIQDTLNKQMEIQYKRFEKYLFHKAHILDAGCGSGRDSIYFKNKAYQVTAIDASKKMCNFAKDLLLQDVEQLRFEEMKYSNAFDAIWASASLLHIPKRHMGDILKRFAQALNPQGILYASFKLEDKEYMKDNRFFNSYTEESFSKLIDTVPFTLKEMYTLEDTRLDKKGEFWLNVLLTVNKS